MDSSDRQRLDAYIRSQNYFRGVAEDVVEAAIESFIRRVMPWLLDQIYAAWEWVRSKLGW